MSGFSLFRNCGANRTRCSFACANTFDIRLSVCFAGAFQKPLDGAKHLLTILCGWLRLITRMPQDHTIRL